MVSTSEASPRSTFSGSARTRLVSASSRRRRSRANGSRLAGAASSLSAGETVMSLLGVVDERVGGTRTRAEDGQVWVRVMQALHCHPDPRDDAAGHEVRAPEDLVAAAPRLRARLGGQRL